MKCGDLVKVNKRCSASLWHKVGIVLGCKRRYEAGKTPLVCVLLDGRERLFDYCDLDMINASR